MKYPAKICVLFDTQIFVNKPKMAYSYDISKMTRLQSAIWHMDVGFTLKLMVMMGYLLSDRFKTYFCLIKVHINLLKLNI